MVEPSYVAQPEPEPESEPDALTRSPSPDPDPHQVDGKEDAPFDWEERGQEKSPETPYWSA